MTMRIEKHIVASDDDKELDEALKKVLDDTLDEVLDDVLDDVLDEVLDDDAVIDLANNPWPPTSSRERALENLRQGRSRLSRLRERVKVRNQRSLEFQKKLVMHMATSTTALEGPILTTTITSHIEKNGLSEEQLQPLDNKEAVLAAVVNDTMCVAVRPEGGLSSWRKLELKEKLRQKEAQLEMLRNSTLFRKRPLEEENSKVATTMTTNDGASSFWSSMTKTGGSLSGENGRRKANSAHVTQGDDSHERVDHIKRVKMMTARKKEQLARYKSTFARQQSSNAAETF